MTDPADVSPISGLVIPDWETEDEPEIIYHYTDTKGMMGIVEKGNLWATDVRYMNDIREPTYPLEAIERLLSDHEPETEQAKKVYTSVQGLIHRARQAGVGVPGYIACLSEKPDLLSQWRAYGHGNGFCIGFDYKGLRELFSSLSQHITIGKVIYDEAEQLDWLFRSAAQSEGELSIFRSFSSLLNTSIFFKDRAFKEEAEVRIYAFQARGVLFRESGLGITSYVTIPLRREGDVISTIRKIIIGPQATANEVKQTLDQFLEASEVQEVEVVHSVVPLRS
jgi:hypothetical protein